MGILMCSNILFSIFNLNCCIHSIPPQTRPAGPSHARIGARAWHRRADVVTTGGNLRCVGMYCLWYVSGANRRVLL